MWTVRGMDDSSPLGHLFLVFTNISSASVYSADRVLNIEIVNIRCVIKAKFWGLLMIQGILYTDMAKPSL
jgi:hypothetical protein